MATAAANPNPATAPLPFSNRIVSVNAVPEEFDLASGLPAGFLEFLAPLHAALTLRQRALVARRERALAVVDLRHGGLVVRIELAVGLHAREPLFGRGEAVELDDRGH